MHIKAGLGHAVLATKMPTSSLTKMINYVDNGRGFAVRSRGIEWMMCCSSVGERSAASDAQHVLELPREYRVFVKIDAFRNVYAYAGRRVTYVRRMETCNWEEQSATQANDISYESRSS
jgi:hypothetical protein